VSGALNFYEGVTLVILNFYEGVKGKRVSWRSLLAIAIFTVM
jgi:hypothetical protein